MPPSRAVQYNNPRPPIRTGKLRIHTETTLNHFDNSTTRLGKILRKFYRDVCSKFRTFDLPQESAARSRRQRQWAGKGKGKENDPGSGSSAPKQRTFNMSTYKLHALGDYVKSIWLFGTTDNYTTQVVCSSCSRTKHWRLMNTNSTRESMSTSRWNSSMHGQTRSTSCRELQHISKLANV